jgi:hypothetical protein
MAKKAKSGTLGTLYTDLENGKFFWRNGVKKGMIDTLNPKQSFYYQYDGAGSPPIEKSYSPEVYYKHLNNIRNAKFEEEPTFKENLQNMYNKGKNFIEYIKQFDSNKDYTKPKLIPKKQ